MGQIKNKARRIKEKERIARAEKKEDIISEFKKEYKAVRKAFVVNFSELIPMLVTDDIGWKVLPAQYSFQGGNMPDNYRSPNWRIMFYTDGEESPAANNPKQCFMEFVADSEHTTDYNERWKNPKWRLKRSQSYGKWPLDDIILWLNDELIEPTEHERRKEGKRNLTFRLIEDGVEKQHGEDFEFLSDLVEWAWSEIENTNAIFYTVFQLEDKCEPVIASLEDVFEVYDKKGESPETLEHIGYEYRR